MKIGFIGLGNMGLPMAEALAQAGHDVTGFDVTPPASVSFDIAKSAVAAVQDCDIVLTMLTTSSVVTKVITDIIAHMPKGALLIDCSTIDVATARACHDLCARHDIAHLDAPVSGGIAAAAAGTLTFMVGGKPASFETAKPALAIMGAKLVHCGESGAGQAAKICNNMILGITMIGTCEAFALADRLGLDRDSLYEVVSGASGQSWSLTSYCPAPNVGPQSPADNDYKPGFSADLMLKDLRLSQIAAETTGTETQMGALATELYRRFVEEGDGSGQDFSAMLKRLTSV